MSRTAVIIDDEPMIREVVRALGHWEELGIEVVVGIYLRMNVRPLGEERGASHR